MWLGFALAGLLESMDNLNYFFPGVPYIPIKPTTLHLERDFVGQPWSSIGILTLAFYPFAIGIAFLLSLEVSFSCWFFYLLTRLENVGAAALGLSQGGAGLAGVTQWPHLGEQGVGSFLAFGLFLLWRARRPLTRAFQATFRWKLAAEEDDPDSPLSPRAALWGGLVGIGLLTAFLGLAGLPLWAGLAFWAIYFLFLLVITRIVAEAGAGLGLGAGGRPRPRRHPGGDGVPDGLGPQALTMFGYLSWFDGEFRDTPMPQQLMAVKLFQESRVPRRQMLWALLIASALSSVVGFWAYLHMYYHFGAASAQVRPALQGVGMNACDQIVPWLKTPRMPDHGALGGMVVGAVVVHPSRCCGNCSSAGPFIRSATFSPGHAPWNTCGAHSSSAGP